MSRSVALLGSQCSEEAPTLAAGSAEDHFSLRSVVAQLEARQVSELLAKLK